MAHNAHVSTQPFEHTEHAPAHSPVSRKPARSARNSKPSRQPSRWSPAQGAKTSLLQNPILERELRSRWRRPLTYIVLLAYAGILSWVAWQLSGTAIMQSAQLAEGFGSDNAQKLPGVVLFEGSVIAQVLVALWASAMLCAPVIARERELKMLPELILANLSPAQIVRGKWLATLGFAAILLVIPLPLQALAFLMGGVSPMDWVGAAALQVGAMILGSALGLWCSALNERVSRAMGAACAGACVGSALLIPGLANLSGGPMLTMGLAVMCVVLALPLLAGARHALEFLPLDSMRPTAIETPVSPSVAPAKKSPAGPTLRPILSEIEPPSAALDAAAEREGIAPEESEREIELSSERVYGQRREPWVFGLLRAVGWHNPLVWRELRTRLRQPFFDVSTLLSIALCLLVLPILGASLFESRRSDAMSVILPFWILCGVSCALSAAQGFTREREQRMLEGLLLSTLSPLSIVIGKVAAPILLCLHAAAWPLALFVAWSVLWSVMNGAAMAGIAILGCAAFALCGAACGTWLSYWCRTSSVSAIGSLALFWTIIVAPAATTLLGPKSFRIASEAFWRDFLAAPLQRFDGSLEFWSAGLFMCALLGAVSLALLGSLTKALRPQALEREGRSLMHTDLTRNLH